MADLLKYSGVLKTLNMDLLSIELFFFKDIFLNSSPPSAPKSHSKPNIIGSDNGLLPVRHQAITRTNADLLSIGPLERNFSEILFEILTFSFKNIITKWRPFCSGGDELTGNSRGSGERFEAWTK